MIHNRTWVIFVVVIICFFFIETRGYGAALIVWIGECLTSFLNHFFVCHIYTHTYTHSLLLCPEYILRIQSLMKCDTTWSRDRCSISWFGLTQRLSEAVGCPDRVWNWQNGSFVVVLQIFYTVHYITILEEHTPRICAVHFIVFMDTGLSWLLSQAHHSQDNISNFVMLWNFFFSCRVCLRERIIAQRFKRGPWN